MIAVVLAAVVTGAIWSGAWTAPHPFPPGISLNPSAHMHMPIDVRICNSGAHEAAAGKLGKSLAKE